MSKLIITIIASAIVFWCVAPAALAQTDPLSDLNLAREGLGEAEGGPDFIDYLGQVIKGVIALLGVLFVAYFVYAGYLWMTAGGAGTQIDKAKTIMIQCVIGLFITVSAYAIADYVLNIVIPVEKEGPIWGADDVGVHGSADLSEDSSFQDLWSE